MINIIAFVKIYTFSRSTRESKMLSFSFNKTTCSQKKKKKNRQTDKNKKTNKQVEKINKNKEICHIAIRVIHRVRKSSTWKWSMFGRDKLDLFFFSF